MKNNNRKNLKKIIIISILAIIITAIIIYALICKNSNNPNFTISIREGEDIVHIKTYYFYDDTITEENFYRSDIEEIPDSTDYTKYYFEEKINITDLKEFVDRFPREEKGTITVTSKKQEKTYINGIDYCETVDDTQPASQAILEKIENILNKASNMEYVD